MKKLSSAQIYEVLREAPGVIRELVERNQVLEEKLAAKERRERVEKIASEMHRKGLSLDVPLETLADHLEKDASRPLDVVEQAVELVAPDMGAKLAQVAGDDYVVGAGSSDLERFLVGGVG